MSSVFISHTSVDKPFARKLTRDLVVNGVRVWLDEAELLVGDSLLKKIASAIEEMRYLVAVLTPDSVKSLWVQKELELAMNQQLSNRDIKVLPIIARNCEMPIFLRDTYWLRMETESEYQAGLQNILKRILPGATSFEISKYVTSQFEEGFGWVRNSKRREKLLDSDETKRISALQESQNLSIGVPIALELMADKSDAVVSAAIECLKNLPSSEAAWVNLTGEDQYIPFGDDVMNGNKIVHYDLVEIMSPIYDYIENNHIPQTTLKKLMGTIYSSNHIVRAISLFSLAQTRYTAILSELISMAIMEEDDLIREIATWGLSQFSETLPTDPRLLNSLLIAANDLVGNVRYQALKGLQNYETEEVLEIIIRMLNDPSYKIAKLAIEELGQRRNDASFHALRTALTIPGKWSHLNDLFRAYIIKSLSLHERSEIEEILILTLSLDRYAKAFERKDGSAKEVVAMCLRALESHGTTACLNIVKPFVRFEETVNVSTKLSGGSASYWSIEVGKTASEVVKRIEKMNI